MTTVLDDLIFILCIVIIIYFYSVCILGPIFLFFIVVVIVIGEFIKIVVQVLSSLGNAIFFLALSALI